MVTTPTIGQLAWGAPLNAALNDLQAQISAIPTQANWASTDQNVQAWTQDPASLQASQTFSVGVLRLFRIVVRAPVTSGNLVISVGTAGVALTAGQNFAALYNTAGTRVAVTADQTAAWGSTGVKTMAFTAPVALAAGFYWCALLSNGVTSPAILRGDSTGTSTTLLNLGTTAATSRYGTFGAALTATPASITPGTITPVGVAYFAALMA